MTTPIPTGALDFFRAAGPFYRMLGGMFFRELTEGQIEAFADLALDYPEDGSEAAKGFASLRRYLSLRGPNARQDLAVDYARVFLAAGVYQGDTAVPYESVYTSDEGILMQDSRDDAVRAYREAGWRVAEGVNEPEDHLAFELEFLGVLSERILAALESPEGLEGARASMEAQLRFIDEHLLNWMPLLQERVDSWAKLPFYPALLRVATAFVAMNRETLEELLA